MNEDYYLNLYYQAEMLVNRIENILEFQSLIPDTPYLNSYLVRLNLLFERAFKRAMRRALLFGVL